MGLGWATAADGHLLASAAGAAHREVSSGTTLLFAGLLVLMILALAFEEKLHVKKSLITGMFAGLTLFLAAALDLLPIDPGPGRMAGLAWLDNVFGERVVMPVYIPAVDWGVIAIILGSTLFVDVVSRSGLFTFIAIKLTKASGGDPFRLLVFYGLLTVLFSALLNNVTAMLIVGSLTGVSLGRLKRDNLLLGFLLVEGLLTNVGGLLTLISSVPNIIVGNAAGIAFFDFFLTASPYVALAAVLTVLLGARRFGVKSLKDDGDRAIARQMVRGFDERDGIESRGFFWTAAAMFILFILTLATTSLLPVIRDLGMGYVAVGFGFTILLRYKSTVDRFYRGMDWDLLLFFVCLFVVINVMEHARVLAVIGHVLERVVLPLGSAASAALLAACAGASAVTDNIPLAAMMAKVVGGLPHGAGAAGKEHMDLWWAVVFGSNLGGNLTPIGSASTVVAVTVMHRHGVRVSFGRFVRLALPFALMHIALAVGYVLLFVQK